MKQLTKSIAVATLAFSLVLPVTTQAAGALPKTASEKPVEISINGQLQTIPADMGKPYLDNTNERVMIPVRYVAEAMNCVVNYVPKTDAQPAGFLIGNRKIFVQMNIGSHEAVLRDNGNSKTVSVDAPALVYDERSYVPVRFISEVLGLTVEWKEEDGKGKVLISGSLEPDRVKEETSKQTDAKGTSTLTVTDKNGQTQVLHY